MPLIYESGLPLQRGQGCGGNNAGQENDFEESRVLAPDRRSLQPRSTRPQKRMI